MSALPTNPLESMNIPVLSNYILLNVYSDKHIYCIAYIPDSI